MGYNWSELQKAANDDITVTDDVTGGMTCVSLVDGTPLTPQQLGLMGMEALETVVGYWEDALAAYNTVHTKGNNNKQPMRKSIVSPEETEFTKLLEDILDGAYQLQV